MKTNSTTLDEDSITVACSCHNPTAQLVSEVHHDSKLCFPSTGIHVCLLGSQKILSSHKEHDVCQWDA